MRKVDLQQSEDFQFVDEPFFTPVGSLGNSLDFSDLGAVAGDDFVGFAMARNIQDYCRTAFWWSGHGNSV